MQAVFTGDGVVPKFEDVSPGVSEGVSSASRSEAHSRASSVRMPVLRSDVRDAVMLPVPPSEYEYILRRGATFLPIVSSERLDVTGATYVIVHVEPTRAEGLGFFELVPTAGVADAAVEGDLPPPALPVFLTPDPALADELSRDKAAGGACLEHAPMLFNMSGALSPDDAYAAEFAGRLSREEIVFHAACSCASEGWSVALNRVLETNILDSAWERNASREVPQPMSEGPDTTTDSGRSNFEDESTPAFQPRRFGRFQIRDAPHHHRGDHRSAALRVLVGRRGNGARRDRDGDSVPRRRERRCSDNHGRRRRARGMDTSARVGGGHRD